MVEEINKVGVVGLGTMGAGIVEVFARAGFTVTGVEIDDAALERGRTHLEKSLAKAVAKGKLTEDEQRAILGRVTFTTSRDDLADAHLAVEAVPERLDIKRSVFADLDRRPPRSWRPTRPRCPSPKSPHSPAAQEKSSGCTSSTLHR